MLERALAAPPASTGTVVRGPFGAPQDEEGGLLKQAHMTARSRTRAGTCLATALEGPWLGDPCGRRRRELLQRAGLPVMRGVQFGDLRNRLLDMGRDGRGFGGHCASPAERNAAAAAFQSGRSGALAGEIIASRSGNRRGPCALASPVIASLPPVISRIRANISPFQKDFKQYFERKKVLVTTWIADPHASPCWQGETGSSPFPPPVAPAATGV